MWLRYVQTKGIKCIGNKSMHSFIYSMRRNQYVKYCDCLIFQNPQHFLNPFYIWIHQWYGKCICNSHLLADKKRKKLSHHKHVWVGFSISRSNCNGNKMSSSRKWAFDCVQLPHVTWVLSSSVLKVLKTSFASSSNASQHSSSADLSVWDSHCNKSFFQIKTFNSASVISKKSGGWNMEKRILIPLCSIQVHIFIC